jgi:hypothetical protein
MITFTIKRSSAASHNTFSKSKKLEPGPKRSKVAGVAGSCKACPPYGSARRWQSLFASFLRRS